MGDRPPLPALVEGAIRRFSLWDGNPTVVVGWSGGADSTALLAALVELPADLRPTAIVAAYLDHVLRPEAGAGEVAALGTTAARLGIPFVHGRADVPVLARARRLSLEDAARRARYDFLARVARQAGARLVAVGHHRDDQAETVLLRLVRGSGARGLAGMRPVRPLREDGALVLVRPLWLADRAAVLAYLEKRGLRWLEDPTNRERRHPRNVLRHDVLPGMESALGPGVRRALVRAADNLASEDEALEVWAARERARRLAGDRLDRSGDWTQLPAAIRQRILQSWWEDVTGLPPLRRTHLEALDLPRGPCRIPLPAGWSAALDANRAVLLRTERGERVRMLEAPGEVEIPGLGIVRAVVHVATPPHSRDRRQAAGPAGGIAWPLTVRPPARGERMWPVGAPGARPVRELLREARIPVPLRRGPCLVCDGSGRILWVAGGRAAQQWVGASDDGGTLLLTLERWSPVSLS